METAYSYNFGQGRVPAHQHNNGGGWVANSAFVSSTAYVGSNARVYGDAKVRGEAYVREHAHICGQACVFENAEVSDWAIICEGARVRGNARCGGWARVGDSACVSGQAHVYDYARVGGAATITGNTHIYGVAQIKGTVYMVTGNITRGVHNKSPIIIKGGRDIIVVQDHEYITLGPLEHSYEYWIVNYEKILSDDGWYSASDIEEYGRLIMMAIISGTARYTVGVKQHKGNDNDTGRA